MMQPSSQPPLVAPPASDTVQKGGLNTPLDATAADQQPGIVPHAGLVAPAPNNIPNPLRDSEAIAREAMDQRGSRTIAPYGSFEAAQLAIDHGHYTALESFDFGTTPDGTPVAMFTDKNGMKQAIRLSSEQWFAMLNQRAQGRVEFAQKLRNKQDAQRLAPAMEQMVKELEPYAPGIGVAMQLGMDRDPMQTYNSLQGSYARLKAGDRAEMMRLQDMADKSQMEVNDHLAEGFVKNQTQVFEQMALGFMDNPNIPNEYKANRLQQIQRWTYDTQRFAALRPPVATAARNASFATYYMQNGNEGAINDLADMVLRETTINGLDSVPVAQRMPMLVSMAQQYARHIGWPKAFDAQDADVVANAIVRRAMTSQRVQIMAPMYSQPGGTEFTAAAGRGMQTQMQDVQQQRAAQMDLQQAKIASEQARAQSYQASAGSAEARQQLLGAQMQSQRASAGLTTARTRQTEALTSLMKGEKVSALAGIDEIYTRMAELGYEMPRTDGGVAFDLMQAYQELSADKSAEGVARLQAFVELLKTVKR
jgi:hypothetical protein